MKKALFFFLLCFGTFSTFAQNFGAQSSIKGRISGTVTDSIAKIPVEYASVSLYKDEQPAPVAGVVTETDGSFKLDGIAPGKYKLVISFIGYADKTKFIETTGAKPDLDLGNISVSANATSLNEVVVQANNGLVANKIDKIVYNVEKDVTAAGGSASDVLQKVPMVSVDINGNVSVRGDANVRILINGKPTGATSANVADVLKTIPADQIKNIEVVTSPSAKYDAEGSAGIINIITKQKNTSGISGSVSGGVGTRQNNLNANVNYNKNRFSLSANLGGNNGWPQDADFSSRQTIDNGTVNTLQTTDGENRVRRLGINGSITAGYEFNAFHNLRSTFRVNDGEWKSDGMSTNVFTDLNNAANNSSYTGETHSKNTWGGFDWNLDYTRKFKKEGHEFTFSSQWSHSKNTTDYVSLFSDFYPNQSANNDAKNNEYTLQLDYTLPVSEKLKLEAGGKTILRRISSNFVNMIPDADGDFIYDPVNSNLYDYDQDVFAGYAVGTITLPKDYTVMAGARIEQTNIKGDPTNALQTDIESFENKYTTFIPSVTLQKKLTDNASLKLSYTKRITRPSLNFLNPFINRSNIQAQTQGNPDLDPEISQTYELGYSTFSQKRTINLSVYYRHISGLIEGIATPLEDESGTITNYRNIGENNSFGMNFFGSVTLFKNLSLRGNFNAYTYKPNASGVFVDQQTQNDTYVQYSAFVSGNYNFKHDLVAEVLMIQNSRRRTLQGVNPAFNLMVFGVKKQFWNKTASIGLNITSPFRNGLEFKSESSGPGFTQQSSFNYPIRSFGLTFSYNFGKMSFSDAGKKGVNNDDLKQGGDQNQGGGMSPGQ
ncbi:MAG: TonB-dependent receptor [Flavobacterium sp.]|uniref:TonB-dependent receptor domain-containing protein n=1 Tax=Flavobacterium sp. TaxID=239 RepID=UPI0012131D7E|nr:TonB-dependent receptor [Flavobacterium sp.]RZJ63377.1 MAG: TonB-dependent receptor [Flavobacterium sp.]